jgi:methionine--tRNA ligase beta chain
MITYDDFAKLEIRIGKVISAEKIENTDKLLKLEVDFGDEKRQIVSGIAEHYKPEDLVEREFPFLTNLEPRMLKGVQSQGMILAIGTKEKIILIKPTKKVPLGSKVS